MIKGRGGHGALPHLSVDPVVISAQVITALQTLVSREKHPFAGAVLTVGTIHGGTAFNIIADRVEMTGTLRTVDNDLRQRLMKRVYRRWQRPSAPLWTAALTSNTREAAGPSRMTYQ